MTSCAWLWIYVGTFLMLMELLAPGFVIFFFGLSAATVGLCRALLGDAFGLTWQLAAFSGFAILYLVVLRRWLRKTFMGGKVETATLLRTRQIVPQTLFWGFETLRPDELRLHPQGLRAGDVIKLVLR